MLHEGKHLLRIMILPGRGNNTDVSCGRRRRSETPARSTWQGFIFAEGSDAVQVEQALRAARQELRTLIV
jgi:hypothetical protein